ncbi:MAG: LysE family translocator [Pseudomonadota bacterium]|nr:LysE family translocator [Pseudomonadota bacterium]
MIPTDILLLFISASLALAVAPGPDNLFVLSQSALFGSSSGLLVTLGLCTGLLLHIAAATLGVAAIFQTSPLAFNLLKAVGASYLVLLAVQAFRAGAAGLEVGSHSGSGARALYFRGIIMNVTNPKVALFFLAFLPQFTDGARGSVALQMLLLGSFFMVSTLLVFGAVACFAGFLGDRLQRSGALQKTLNRVAGAIFIGLAVRLLMAER